MDNDEETVFHASLALGNSDSDKSSWLLVAATVIAYPFDLAKTLIQIGYEPLPPYPTRNLWGRPRLALPGVFTYLGYIIRDDGQGSAMFRGLSYRIAERLAHERSYDYLLRSVSNYLTPPFVDVGTSPLISVNENIVEFSSNDNLFKQISKSTIYKDVKEFSLVVGKKSLCKFCALAISYPLNVMAIRTAAQLVGKETLYDSPISGIKDIFVNEGIKGFYAGFTPRLCCDVFFTVIVEGVEILVIRQLFKDNKNNSFDSVSNLLSLVLKFITPNILYPYALVSKIMAVNSCKSLQAAKLEPNFVDWRECWSYLSLLGQLKRGSTIIFRYQPMPSREIEERLAFLKI